MMDWRRLLSARRLGQTGAEPVNPGRSPFQKDWDRVVFCSAFRRLQDKTQVHSLPESDYVRTRLTHSLEVSSVGRSLGALVGQTVAQRHSLPEGVSAAEFGNIAAAACLAHDIGNPPYGHFGEDILRHWFADASGGARYLEGLTDAERADITGFDGNAQGFRVLTRLQNWRDAGGLRLTAATLGTFTKYPWGSGGRQTGAEKNAAKFGFFAAERDLFAGLAAELGLPRAGESDAWARHPLAFLVEAADDICYRIVDLEDGYKLGRIGFFDAEQLLLDLVGDASPRYPDIEDEAWRIAHLRATAIGRLIEQAAAAFLDHESDILAGRMGHDLLAHCPARGALAAIAELTQARIFRTRERFQTEVAGAEILTTLLAAFADALAAREASSRLAPSPRATALLRLVPGPMPAAEARYDWLLRLVDFVSGMTDGYALTMFRRIKGLMRE